MSACERGGFLVLASQDVGGGLTAHGCRATQPEAEELAQSLVREGLAKTAFVIPVALAVTSGKDR